MIAAYLLAELTEAGFALRGVAGKIMVSPASRLSPDQRAAVTTMRGALLALLDPEEPDWESACRSFREREEYMLAKETAAAAAAAGKRGER